MKFSYLYHVKHLGSIRQSAIELGVSRLLWLEGVVAVSCIGFHFLAGKPPAPASKDLWMILSLGLIAAFGALLMPKEVAYIANNPLFEEQIRWIRKFIKNKNTNSKIELNLHSSNEPKQFDLGVDEGEKPHVIFLFLESFASNGAHAAPCFESLKRQGIFFPNFYSNGTLTYRALLSSLFGIPPGSSAAGLPPYLDVSYKSIPKLLKSIGYTTAFQHNGSLSYDGYESLLSKHFDEVVDRSAIPNADSTSWGVHDEHLMRYSADWLEKQQGPAFLSMLTVSNHHPWKVPDHYKAPTFDAPLNSAKQRYLQTVHYTDHSLDLFLKLLCEKNLSKKTILFILGDHGQPMGEHRENFYNSRFLYEENVHVPLLILADGRIGPKVINDVSSQIDLFPTIVDLFNLKVPSLGSSLVRKSKNRCAYFQNPYSEGFAGCRKEKWKWIENSLSQKGELYNLDEDPKEILNIESMYPQLADQFRRDTRVFFEKIDNFYHDQKKIRAKPKISKELDLSKTPLITDKQLKSLLTSHLLEINLENCLLLTDKSISSIFSKCPHLEKLNLKGIFDLRDQVFELAGQLPHLLELDLSDAHQLTNKSIERLIGICPNLQKLSLNAKSLTDQGISLIGRHYRHLTWLKIYDADQLSDGPLIDIFESNVHLSRLVLSGGIQLTDLILEKAKKLPLEQFWLFQAPKITDVGIIHLCEAPIRSLSLSGCHLLTKEALALLQKLKLESIHLE